MSLSYTITPFQPTNPYPNQVTTELNLANQNFTTLAQAFVNADPTSLTVVNSASVGGYGVGSATNQIPLNNGTLNIMLNADMVDGFHASATPTPNTLLPLNSNAVFYNALSTTTQTDNFNLTLADSTTYTLVSVAVSTPSQPLVNNYKVVFRLTVVGGESASGFNNFQLSIATANQNQVLAYWWWWVPGTGIGMGFTDVAIFDQPPNTTVSYTIKCSQAGGNANFILGNLTTQYAVFPG